MRQRWSPTTKRVVIGTAALVVVLLLVRASDVLGPFVWAAIFAYVFAPVVALAQRRTGAPRWVIVATLFVILTAALYALGRVLVPVAFQQLRDVPRTLPQLTANVQAIATEAVSGTELEGVVVGLFEEAEGIVRGFAERILPVALGIVVSVIKALVFIIALWFLLLDGPRLGRLLRDVLPASQRDEWLQVLGRINAVLGQYVRGQVVLIGIMWTATSIGLSLLGVPFSILLGFVTGVLETIPFVGPITAGAIAVLVALGHPNPFGWSQLAYAAVVALMYTVLRHAEDYFVIPTLIGRIVELHPLVVIFSLLVGGAVGGLLGVVLAVPIAASLRIASLYALAKLRDQDPYPVIAEAAAEPGERVPEVSERTA